MRSDAGLTPDVAVHVTTKGVTSDAAEYARTKIGRLGKYAHRPVRYARVRLSALRGAAVQERVVAQANLDVDGRIVRAQVEGATAREAIDLIEERLRHRLHRAAEHWEARRGRMSTSRSTGWRHDSEPAHRPTWYPRPADERRIIRRKSFSIDVRTVDEAVAEMEFLDHDFHLFTETGTKATSVLYRGGPSGYRLALLAPELIGELSPFEEPVVISPHPAPCLSESAAIERLNVLGMPFLFFIDAAEGRACVLYHRYDGHYGLITPAG